MSEITLENSCCIGDGKMPYIIAEVNSSHNGNVETAQKMIDAAVFAGCQCVKFQSWSAETLYSQNFYSGNPIAKRIVQKFSLAPSELQILAEYCREKGIAFSSTPYSCAEADWLIELGAPFLKISSMEINHYDFLKYLARTQKPLILSTGMADMEEIKKAVELIHAEGCRSLVLLHCISIYPAAPETINLNNITMLKQNFPECPVGFSDHTLGTEISAAAVALGAAVIEKHLTLDKSRPGMDNNMAIEPEEMTQLVRNCRNVFSALGNFERIVSPAEYGQREKMRRSVIVVKDLPAGTVLSRSDLAGKRPGNGIPVSQLDSLVGRKLSRDVAADTLLHTEDIE